MAATECKSAEKNRDGSSKYIIRYYKPNERPGVRNQFANVQVFETEKMVTKDYQPLTFTLCVAKPSGYGIMVRCDSSMGSYSYLMIENIRNSGAYQDGPFKLFNLACGDLK
tara:strand:+ start:13703 stop:14035 length:333 start_codon:yes stop_codon:yes gene_type:complete